MVIACRSTMEKIRVVEGEAERWRSVQLRRAPK